MVSMADAAGASLREMTGDRLKSAIIRELRDILAGGYTQEKLGDVLHYDGGSQVSKILRGTAELTLEKADRLDAAGFVPTIGGSFHALAVERRAKLRRQSRPTRPARYDLFLAVPMASTDDDDDFAKVQRASRSLVDALQNSCNFEVYCAALQINARDDFDAAAFALEDNVRALRASERFALWVPHPLTRPSSVWVETGIALAWNLPCTFFVPSLDVLPYILTEARSTTIQQFGALKFFVVNDQGPAPLVRKNKARLFDAV